MPTTVLVLAGSPVDQFHVDLSTVYATGFLDAMAGEPEYRIHIAVVTPGGRWQFVDSLSEAGEDGDLTLSQAMETIVGLHVDVVVPQMFCLPGMTAYRSLFDLVSVPVLGNRPDVMAMTADKNIARSVVADAGVAVPRGEVLRAPGTTTVSFPLVVKPVNSDNSVGVHLVREAAGFDAALDDALRYSDAALVETYVALGREVRCGIIARDGELVCLPLEEYAVDEASPIRSRADKLNRSDSGDLYLVAKDSTKSWIVDTSDPITEGVWSAARAAYVALGCRHYGLFDFRVDPNGDPWFLEAGLYCSYSPGSVIAVMASAVGIPVTELFALSLNELENERIRL
ncbi:D-alanine--D-alanine ligase [Gordonia McavH-238-E]|uniref:D-alanine--D-alanine ligase family protein n=1 Tax=Gordonia sp. McavH-238-E TaxID=2917736 RepID=UPI001EF6758C|nr:D-alanine--D-alanine ligase [Gordonia sp. McavH-238-E]MCG7634517.1 D-alanine--D-alanine ligase [Gordonia sp. McavH-238-E]